MRDGYYLSAFIHVNELGFLISRRSDYFFRHDQNISLWYKEGGNVRLIHYWELERITGIKEHSISFYNTDQAIELINNLLKEYDITIDDIVEIWGTPLLDTVKDYHSIDDYPKLEYHNIAHLFSAVLSDTKVFSNNTIIGLSVDAGPDYALEIERGALDLKKYFFSGCVSINGSIKEVFPVSSPGFLWGNAALHFRLKEGTLMALAGACKCELYNNTFEDLTINNWDTSFHSNSQANNYVASIIKKVNKITEKDTGILFSGFDPKFTEEENKISMVMKIIQKTSINIVMKDIDAIIEKYGIDPKDTYLAIAGGYALNCPTNSYLMHKYGFKGFIAPPCVNDSGLSLGIALYAFYKKLKKFNFQLKNAYYGNSYDNLDEAISSDKFKEFIKSVSSLNLDQLVDDIIQFPVVWYNGRGEMGPRALGNRSILADPRSEKSKDILNEVKQRQWWRPVAPIVLEDDVGEWFADVYKSPFMLHTFKIKDEKINLIPAVSHLDTSARVQTVSEDDNKPMYQLLKKFKDRTGIPILCNTSLNDRGEPIIDRIEEALNFGLRKGIPVVYINNMRIELKNHSEFPYKVWESRKIDFAGFISREEKEKRMDELSVHNLPYDILSTYSPVLYNTIISEKETDIKILEKIVKKIKGSKNYV